MSTRYEQLRVAVANLAAHADTQVAYLDGISTSCTGGKTAERYGNVELVEEFYDIFLAINHMFEFNEIEQPEIDGVLKLYEIVRLICSEKDDELWARQALFSDERWAKIRSCASEVLKVLPDEPRESDFTRGLSGGGR